MKQAEIETRFGPKSSTEEVLNGVDLGGKLVVVTGGAQGIGLATTLAFARAGADVVIGGRNLDALQAAKTEAERYNKENPDRTRIGSVTALEVDLLHLGSIDKFSTKINQIGRPVDVLVHNAGINSELVRNELGIESQLMVNGLAPAIITSNIRERLLEAQRSRVIVVASHGHQWSPVIFDDLNFDRREYNRWLSYGQSKTAAIYVAIKIADAMRAGGVDAFALHPGAIMTNIATSIPKEDLDWVMKHSAIPPKDAWKTVDQGASTTIWAATEALLQGRGPLYLEDCAVAEIVDEPKPGYGVMRYALELDSATRLWSEAERMIGRDLPL